MGTRVDRTKVSILINRIVDGAIPIHLDKLNKHAENINKLEVLPNNTVLLNKEKNNAFHTIRHLKDLSKELLQIKSNLDENSDCWSKKIDEANDIIETSIGNFIEKTDVDSPGKLCALEPPEEYQTPAHLENSNLLVLESSVTAAEKYKEWCQIQTDLEGIKDIMASCHNIVDDHKEILTIIDDNVISSESNITFAKRHLKACADSQAKFIPYLGAAIGSVVAGPLGLLIGAKVAGAAAVGGAIVGFLGGRELKKSELQGGRLRSAHPDTDFVDVDKLKAN